MQYYNVHTHTFTMNNAPEKFLSLYLPPAIAKLIDKVTNTQAGAWSVEKLLKLVGGNGGKRYASFLKIGKSKNQLEVFETLVKQYDDQGMQFISLAMDMEHCGAGASLSGYEGQLEELLTIKKQYPNKILLFLGVDPRWKESGQQLLATVKKYFDTPLAVNDRQSVSPFVGLKIYPSMGFYAFDEKLMPTFEWAAANNVPILSHCNYLGGIFNNDTNHVKNSLTCLNPYSGLQYDQPRYTEEKSFVRWILGRNKANNNLNGCSYFMEPFSFFDMLNYFDGVARPRLKVCLAHFGGGNQITSSISNKYIPIGVGKENWYTQIQKKLKEYPGLYTDISYALHDKSIHDILLEEITNTQYGDRVMFGTDYFLTERELDEKTTYGEFKKAAVVKNLWDKVAGDNVKGFLDSNYFRHTTIL